MIRSPVLLAGATPLVTALGVRFARLNWPVAGLWDSEHARALTSSLRIGCCAFVTPEEPLGRAGLLLLGAPWAAGRPPGVTVIATFPDSGEASWIVPEHPVGQPDLDLTSVRFTAAGAGCDLARELGLTCSNNGV